MDSKHFVKDKNNLLSHNLWSGGELLNNSTGFSNNTANQVIISSDYSTNGVKSFKLTKTKNGVEYFYFHWLTPYTETGSTLILTWDTKVVNNAYYAMALRAMNENARDLSRQSISITQTSINNQLSITIPENNSYISCFITMQGDENSIIYLDNLHLNSQ